MKVEGYVKLYMGILENVGLFTGIQEALGFRVAPGLGLEPYPTAQAIQP